MRFLILAGFTAAALGLSACTAEVSEAPDSAETSNEDSATPKAKLVSFKVDGMT